MTVLETIEVDEQKADHGPQPVGPGQRLGEAVEGEDAVRQLRNVVVVGLAKKLLLVILADRDVFLDRQEMRDLSGRIGNRRNGSIFPVELAVLFAVVEFAAPFVPGGDGLPQFPVVLLRHVAGFEQARALPDDFIRAVAGDLDELRIDVFDAAVGSGDQRRRRALLDGQGQLTDVLFGLHAVRDVQRHRDDEVDLARFGFQRSLGGQELTLVAVGVDQVVFQVGQDFTGLENRSVPFDLFFTEFPAKDLDDRPTDGFARVVRQEIPVVAVEKGVNAVAVAGADQGGNGVDDVAQLSLALAELLGVLVDCGLQFLLQRYRPATDDLLLPPHGQQIERPCPEFVVVDGAAEEIRGARLERTVAVVPILIGGDHDDRYIEALELPSALPNELGAVHLRHQEIGNDEIDILVDHPFERLPGVVEGVDFCARFQGASQSGENIAVGDAIVDNDDDRHEARQTSSTCACSGYFPTDRKLI